MAGERYRIVTHRDHERFVSSVALTEDEAFEQLATEAYLHELAGWTVTRGEALIICRRGDALRTIEIRRFSPLDDDVSL